MFVIPSIFTAIQRVKTGMFYKINCVIFMLMRFIYYAMGTKLTNYKSLAF